MRGRLFRHLTIPVVPISVLLLSVGIWAAWRVQHLQERVSREVRENVSAMRAAEELEILIRELRTRVEQFRISGDRRQMEAIGTIKQEIDRWMAEMVQWSFTPREHELSSQARRGWQSLREKIERISNNPTSMTPEELDQLENLLTRELLTPTHEFLDLNEDEVDQSVTENQVAADRLVFGLLFLGICGAGAGLAAGFWLARRLIERLELSERTALRAEQLAAMGHLAAGMAHELHNPLTTIKMLVQGALTESNSSPVAGLGMVSGPVLTGRDLSVVDEEITRLEEMVRSFLDFARAPLPEKRVVDVGSIVDQTLALVAGQISVAGVTIAWKGAAESIRMAVDPGQFRQLVLNLVLNALDAVKAGDRIELQLSQDKRGDLTLRVMDNGCGLSPELGQKIFDPFITSKETGLGLGLSICKQIAEAHGGTITGSNRPNGGAEFVVRFPAESPKRAR
jgi:signal transduction histidine kinase